MFNYLRRRPDVRSPFTQESFIFFKRRVDESGLSSLHSIKILVEEMLKQTYEQDMGCQFNSGSSLLTSVDEVKVLQNFFEENKIDCSFDQMPSGMIGKHLYTLSFNCSKDALIDKLNELLPGGHPFMIKNPM